MLGTPGYIRGRGDYFSDVGGAIGHSIGSTAGSLVSGVVGDVGKIFGMGDYKTGSYKVRHNSMAPRRMMITGHKVPKFATHGRGVEIAHRENLGYVTASGTVGQFKRTTFAVNPGEISTFPWAKNVAENFEEYQLLGCVFEFVSTYSDAVVGTGASGNLGNIIMASEYNVVKVPFTDEQSMLNHEYSVSCKPSENMIHPIECDMKENPLKVLFVTHNGPDVPGVDDDPRFHDLCNFSIASTGTQVAGDTLGQLWVSYHIRFLKPRQTIASEGAGLPFYAGKFGPGEDCKVFWGDPADVKAVPDITLPAPVFVNEAGASPSHMDLSSYPPGNYICVYLIGGPSVTYTTSAQFPAGWAISDTTAMDELKLFGRDPDQFAGMTSPSWVSNNAFEASFLMSLIAFTINEPSPSNTISVGANSDAAIPGDGGGNDGDVFIIAINSEWAPDTIESRVTRFINSRLLAAGRTQFFQGFPSAPVEAFEQKYRAPVGKKAVDVPPGLGLGGFKELPKTPTGALARQPTTRLDPKSGKWVMVPAQDPPEERKAESKKA